jgi:hypothetical protein
MSKEKISTPSQELTSEELTSLQQLLSAFNKAKVMLADATIVQQEALEAVMATKVGFSTMENKLIEVYGKDVSVNIETGALTYKE